jgi:hypothetical protein
MSVVFVCIAVLGVIFVVGFVLARSHPAGSRLDSFASSTPLGQDGDLETKDRVQMLEALNQSRRRRGLPDLAEAEFEAVADDKGVLHNHRHKPHD